MYVLHVFLCLLLSLYVRTCLEIFTCLAIASYVCFQVFLIARLIFRNGRTDHVETC